MAKIIPFKAVRPVRNKVHLVSSRPYYTYKKRHLRAKLESNPYTFLHVINPEFNKKDKTLPNSIERFEAVAKEYNRFKSNQFLQKEKKPSLYIYRQSSAIGVFTGIIAGASIDDYKNNKIKKHENTIINRENLFKKYLDVCKFHVEPVLLTYSSTTEILNSIKTSTNKRPEYEFTTSDEKVHELWVINNTDTINKICNEFESIDDIYIADGHHRAASSLLYKNDHAENKLSNYFLSFFIDKKDIKIIEFNRFIKSIAPLTEEKFLEKLAFNFNIDKIGVKYRAPTNKKQISLFINNNWHLLEVKKDLLKSLNYKKQLNSQIASDLILTSILKIKDLRTDKRVEFINGNQPVKNLTNKVRNEPGSMAICLYPHNIEEIIKIADNSETMPPKSTWIEPKLRSGITIYEY